MGTSVNQSSPRTLNWLAAQATYRNAEISPQRVMVEVWRAATNQPSGDLATLLAQPIIARLRELSNEVRSVTELWGKATALISQSKETTLAVDIARRAAVQCIGSKDRTRTYNERLFAEATAYLMARDLPGFVGAGRTKTISDSLEFKSAVMDEVVHASQHVTPPKSFTSDAWSKYVQAVIAELKGKAR